LNALERRSQGSAITAIELNIVARRVSNVQANRLANDARDGFGFELANIARRRPVSRTMAVGVAEALAAAVSAPSRRRPLRRAANAREESQSLPSSPLESQRLYWTAAAPGCAGLRNSRSQWAKCP